MKRFPAFVATLFIIPLSISAQFTQDDATILTLRHQQSIYLDSTLYGQISATLSAARTATDTLNHIHALPDYIANQLLLSTGALWAEPWQNGELRVSDTYIDSLCQEYELHSVEFDNRIGSSYTLTFSHPLKITKLASLFDSRQDIIYAEPNARIGDGDDIQLVRRPDSWDYAFSRGTGDCMAGCIHRYYWYVSVQISAGDTIVSLEDELPRDFSQPLIYRWNIPSRYAMTMFPDADSVFSAISGANQWWIRTHAIEGVRRLYLHSSPWVGEDMDRQDHWDRLRTTIFNRQNELISLLQQVTQDPDTAISASAGEALLAIHQHESSGTDPGQKLPEKPSLGQNYPNPFNTTTQIPFTLSTPAVVTFRIYDIRGRQVALLGGRKFPAGDHTFRWKIEQLPSGIYYYQLIIGNQITGAMKAVYLK